MTIRMVSAVLVGTLIASATQPAAAQVVHRDLQEWLDAQGTLFPGGPGVRPGFFGFVNDSDINEDGVPDGPSYFLRWDYADLLERAFPDVWGTQITGTAKERPLGNGMSEVTVSLHVQNANISVVRVPFEGDISPFLDDCTVFGFRADDVAFGGETPALVDGYFRIVFLHPTGAPFIDLIQTVFDGNFLGFQMTIQAEGPLMFEECGVDTGRLGRLTWGKPGLMSIPPALDPDKVHGAGLSFPNDDFHLFKIRQGQ